MEAGFIALMVVIVISAVMIGMYLGKKKAERRYVSDTQFTQGTLNVDCVDPEFKPNLYLGLSIPVEKVITRKYVVLDVNVWAQNSHK